MRNSRCSCGRDQAAHRARPDDDVVIGSALAAKADLIVTGDKPLLTVSE